MIPKDTEWEEDTKTIGSNGGSRNYTFGLEEAKYVYEEMDKRSANSIIINKAGFLEMVEHPELKNPLKWPNAPSISVWYKRAGLDTKWNLRVGFKGKRHKTDEKIRFSRITPKVYGVGEVDIDLLWLAKNGDEDAQLKLTENGVENVVNVMESEEPEA